MTEQTMNRLERTAIKLARMSFLAGVIAGAGKSYFTSNYLTNPDLKPILYGALIGASIAAVPLGVAAVSYITRKNIRGQN